MKSEIKEIDVNGITYVPKESIPNNVEIDGLKLVLIRTYSAGVHYGYIKERASTLAGIEVKLINSVRIWSWSGAASLSQLAMEGVNNPESCKFAMPVNEIDLIAIEIIPITSKALESLNKVEVWKK